jgi:hypothetical protein
VGVAWDVHGDGRMAVRSSYSLMYDFPSGEFFSNLAGAPPYGNRTLVTDPAGLFDNPYRVVGGDPHPIVTGPDTPFPVGGAFAAMDPISRSTEKATARIWLISPSVTRRRRLATRRCG